MPRETQWEDLPDQAFVALHRMVARTGSFRDVISLESISRQARRVSSECNRCIIPRVVVDKGVPPDSFLRFISRHGHRIWQLELSFVPWRQAGFNAVVRNPDLAKVGRLLISTKPNSTGVSSLSELSHLTNLVQLHLYQNMAVESIRPTDWGPRLPSIASIAPLAGLTKLESLSISGHHNLVDTAPLTHLTNLTSLHLGFCNAQLSLRPLRTLPALRQLAITDGDQEALVELQLLGMHLPQLQELVIDTQQGIPIGCLAHLSGLSKLVVAEAMHRSEYQGPPEHHPDISALALLPRLRVLDVGISALRTVRLQYGGLRHLVLRGLTPYHIFAWQLPNLRSLGLHYRGSSHRVSRPSGSPLPYPQQHPHSGPLRTLADEVLCLPRLPRCHTLYVCHGHMSTLDAQGLPVLRNLYVKDCPRLADLSPEEIFEQLTVFDLQGDSPMEMKIMAALVSSGGLKAMGAGAGLGAGALNNHTLTPPPAGPNCTVRQQQQQPLMMVDDTVRLDDTLRVNALVDSLHLY